jgi:DNA-binding MarR family transcriptional regulator
VAESEPVETVDGGTELRGSSVPVVLGRLGELLGYNIRIAQLAAFDTFGDCMQDDELSPTLAGMLLLIQANPGIKQTDIAATLRVDRSTMVRLVDRCEARNLVKRAPSRIDRRVTTPALTDDGREYVESILPKIARHEATVAGRLSAGERDALLQLLRRLNGIAS